MIELVPNLSSFLGTSKNTRFMQPFRTSRPPPHLAASPFLRPLMPPHTILVCVAPHSPHVVGGNVGGATMNNWRCAISNTLIGSPCLFTLCAPIINGSTCRAKVVGPLYFPYFHRVSWRSWSAYHGVPAGPRPLDLPPPPPPSYPFPPKWDKSANPAKSYSPWLAQLGLSPHPPY